MNKYVERGYISRDDGEIILRNVGSLDILVHDVINLLYYEHWTDKQNIFCYTR